MKTVAYVGGGFVAPESAIVSLLDAGYLLGDGVFATMRAYGGVCFRADRHLAELARGAAVLGIDVPMDVASIAALANDAARRTEEPDAYVRVTLTRGAPGARPTLSVLARAMDVPSARDYAHGVAVVTVTPRRIPPACLDGSIKTTSYAVQVLARREVQTKNAAEGIQLAIDGALACGTMSNLFVISKGALLTPSLESGCRAGVTRAAVLELAPRLFERVREERLDPSILDDADEAFLTSTRVECLPIAAVDGRPVGGGRRPRFERTHALHDALVSLVRAETAS